MFTSPNGLKSSRSMPPSVSFIPPSPHASRLFFLLPFNMVSDIYLLHCFNWFSGTSYKLFGNPPNRIWGPPLQDVNLLAIWKAAHLTKPPQHWNPGALYGPIRHPHGRLTADPVTWQLKPYEEESFSFPFTWTLFICVPVSLTKTTDILDFC